MNKLRECRDQSGLSQKQVALEIGVRPPTVSQWESGIKSPSRENILKLAKLYQVSVEYLLDEQDEKKNPPPMEADSRQKVSGLRRRSIVCLRTLAASWRSTLIFSFLKRVEILEYLRRVAERLYLERDQLQGNTEVISVREWLRKMRIEKSMTEKEVASAAGIAQPFYHNIEMGTKNPSVDTAKRIAIVLGFNWTMFF